MGLAENRVHVRGHGCQPMEALKSILFELLENPGEFGQTFQF